MSFKISNNDWKKVINYSKYAWDEHGSEIGGYMVVIKEDDGFVMKEPVILEQEISAGNTVIKKEALAKYQQKAAMEHGTDVYFCWWHSHHTMQAFWSGTDLAAIQQSKYSDASFSLVVNLKEEYLFRVSIWEPVEVHVDVDIRIEGKDDVPKYIVNDVESLCSKPEPIKIVKSKQPTWQYGGYYPNKQTVLDLGQGKDDELTNVEADVDNILLDYITSNMDYKGYKASVKKLNKKLEQNDSQLRVGIISEDNIDEVIHFADAESYIYRVGMSFDETAVLELHNYNKSWERFK
jgi:proteasome lid subunit RPN8/RPN11